MSELKHEHLITYGYRPSVSPEWVNKVPRDTDHIIPLVWVDAKIVPGGFYFDAEMVYTPSLEGSFNEPPMIHEDWDEVLAMFGTNSADPESLGGEVEFVLGDEKHTITKTCAIFIPKGLSHGPLTFKTVTSPILLLATGNTKEYTQTLTEGWERLLG
jgi:hypothetical protein